MLLVKQEPTKLRILDFSDSDIEKLRKALTFKKKEVVYQIQQLKKTRYFQVSRYGEEAFQNMLDKLNKEINGCLLYEDDRGYYTLTGLQNRLENLFPAARFVDNVEYPEFKLIPWQKMPDKEPRYYQAEAIEKLLVNPLSHIEFATGAGKSLIILHLVKKTGLPSVVVTPSASIGRQLYNEAVELFGKKNVGLFGDGKREIGKKILISIAKSVAMVEEPEILEQFKMYKVCITDESHQVPSELLSKSALHTLAHCPYRWFVSATQERNDGRDIMLEGIIGPKVHEKTINDLQNEGFLAKIDTMVMNVKSKDKYTGSNTLKVNQHHFLYNKNILSAVTMLIQEAIASQIPTLILIDEKDQEMAIKNAVGNVYEFAHGGSDTTAIVDRFNSGETLIVVGTSAVSVGTDFRPVRMTINWMANRSSVKVKQGAIGRSTRICTRTGKKDCKIIDFCVENIDILKRHVNDRIKLYKEVGPVSFMDWE